MSAPPSTKWLEESNRLMHNANFTMDQVHAAVVWAARWQACPKEGCGAQPYERCRSLAHSRKRGDKPIYNRWPHEVRVDRQKLVEALKQKGYK